MRYILSLLFFICLSANRLAAEDWYEVKSDHFLIYTNISKDRARETITDLEKFRFTVGLLTNLDVSEDFSPPLKLYIFKSRQDYSSTLDAANSIGFYQSHTDGAVSAISFQDRSGQFSYSALSTVYHEYVHHIIHQYSPIEYPRWYDEGFAEYLSTVEFDGDVAIVGKPAQIRFFSLRDTETWISVKDMIETKNEYLGSTSGSRRSTGRLRPKPTRGQFYSQSWLMAHFLQHSEKYQENLAKYLVASDSGDASEEEIFEAAFGVNYKALERNLKGYWGRSKFGYARFDLKGTLPKFKTKLRKMSKREKAAIRYEAQHDTGRLSGDNIEKATATYQDVLSSCVRMDMMRIRLAEMAVSNGDWQTASKYLSDILAEKPDHAPALTLKARVIAQGQPLTKLSEDKKKAVRKVLTSALKADMDYVPGLLAYANLYMDKDREVNQNALNIVDSALYLAPDVNSIHILKARLLAKSGDMDQAKATMDKLIAWAFSDAARTRYQEILDAMVEQYSSS